MADVSVLDPDGLAAPSRGVRGGPPARSAPVTSRCGVLAPRTRFVKVVRPAAVKVTGTARGKGMTAPGPIAARSSAPRHGIITSPDAAAQGQ